jgi:phosphopentomutase
MSRVIVIVLDGCGVGALPDAARYGATDPHSNTLEHVLRTQNPSLPNLERLGLARLVENGPSDRRVEERIVGAYGKCAEASAGKDSVTGHWEMMGIVTEQPFPTYPDGFPSELVRRFEREIGREVLGNKAASGTEIIKELGEEHVRTGKPIVYTSADSVFQIAAHEVIVPLEELYSMCRIGREMLVAPHNVQRVIARPFMGSAATGFTRTTHRKDFPLPPPEPNVLTAIRDSGKRIHGIGVIVELFPAAYFARAERTQSNAEHLAAIRRAIEERDADLIFANCEDFDMLYGHRNDPAGFAAALSMFDQALGDILNRLRPDDLLILTADHGNDPTTISTDHSREYVPLLIYGSGVEPARELGIRSSFADVGATAASVLQVPWSGAGASVPRRAV